jgi:serine phosphatase RsbU (regulator of sigma subunit)/anti-sigma regulatory factor (Ser/Thr protein kinase)
MSFTRQPVEGLRLDFCATLEDAREVVREIVGWLAEQQLTAQECTEWELVLAEATTNAVTHGRSSQPLRIEAVSTATTAEVRITDHSSGFDWPEAVSLPESDESESGRGLFIIHSLTDHVSYLKGRSENVLCLRRSRRTVRPPAEDLGATLDLMTAEVSSCYETIANIFRVSSEAARDVSPDALVESWLEELRLISGADFITLRMLTPDGTQLEGIPPAARLSKAEGEVSWSAEKTQRAQGSQETLDMALESQATTRPFSIPIIDLNRSDVIESRAVSMRQDQWFDGRTVFDQSDPLRAQGAAVSGIAHPLEAGGEVIGVLTLGVRTGHWEPKACDLNVVRSLGDFLGTLLLSLRRRDAANHSRLIKRELQIAADIQRSLLPAELPQSTVLQCAGHMTSVGEVGGDFFAGLPLADGGRLFVIADVMGKGVPAALFATAFRSLLHSHLDLAPEPGQLMRHLNSGLFAELDRAEMFITVQLAYVSADGLTLRTCGAGHGPLLLTDGLRVTEVGSDGPPLGVIRDVPYAQEESSLEGTSHILIHTDGLCDYTLPDGAGMGRGQLHDWLRSTSVEGIDAWSCRDSLLHMHCLIQSKDHPHDDATFVVLVRDAAVLPQPKKHSLTHEHR